MTLPTIASAQAIPVELRHTEQGWQLLRDGQPYFIRGAGGTASLEKLAAAGGNSVRTWDTADIDSLLDEAHALGISVTIGIWLGHERHGFDYSNAAQVSEQLHRARQAVLKYKDHPAVLLWGVGNEMEGFAAGDNPAIWKAVDDIAAMIREIDPAHPTMTVTAEIGGARIENIHERCPHIDIHGVNSYGGAQSLVERLRAGGATKPYILTEFGPLGPWESRETPWGAPVEQTSTEKAAFYRRSYQRAVNDAAGLSLGSYAFLWGSKMEGTATWFGMFLDDGAPLGVVDTLAELWSGAAPEDRAPTVEPLLVDGQATVEPGAEISVKAVVADAEKSEIRARWVLRPESDDYMTGGDFRPQLPDIDGAILEGNSRGARVRMPDEPGPYRLFLYAYGPGGNAATANLPLLVEGERRPRLPVSVYEDGFDGMPWVPSGWMGSIESLSVDGEHTDGAHAGRACIRMRYTGTYGWVGVAWQAPPNNWGERDGGYDLTGATRLELWARGEYGGEKISIGVGLLGEETAHPDTIREKVDGIVLSREWRRYEVPLKRRDLSSLKTGFVVTLTGRSSAVTVYLDSIRFLR